MTEPKKRQRRRRGSVAGRMMAQHYRRLYGPRWRIHAAERVITANRKKYHQFSDDKVRDLAKLWKRRRRFTDDELEFRAYFQAAQAIEADERGRLDIDARVLARMPQAEIAQELAIHPPVLRAYEDYVFDARSLADAPSAMYCHVIPEGTSEPLRNLVLSMAYRGGMTAADWILERVDALGKKHDLTTQRGRELETIELMLLHRRHQWSLTLTENQQLCIAAIFREPLQIDLTPAQLIERRVSEHLARILSFEHLDIDSNMMDADAKDEARDAA